MRNSLIAVCVAALVAVLLVILGVPSGPLAGRPPAVPPITEALPITPPTKPPASQGRRALDTHQEDVRIIRYGSFSKSLAPGFRLGWCVPGEYETRIRAAKVTTTMSTPTITQLAAAEFMKQGTYARCVEELRDVFEVKTTWLREHIAQTFPEGTRLSDPAGGHVLWLEFPDVVNTSELFERCVEQGVSFAPGELFSNSGAFRSCLRINVALDWDERNLDALGVIAAQSKAMLSSLSKRPSTR